MLTCVPQTLCTWDFRAFGTSSDPALLTFNFFTEQGGISLGGSEFLVRKHGPMSGRWTVERDGTTYADAHKPRAMFRSFAVSSGEVELVLEAQSVLTRGYDILANGSVVGTIEPAHAFTRRAFVKCNSSVPELAQLFSFWLVVLTWRRAAQNNAATTN